MFLEDPLPRLMHPHPINTLSTWPSQGPVSGTLPPVGLLPGPVLPLESVRGPRGSWGMALPHPLPSSGVTRPARRLQSRPGPWDPGCLLCPGQRTTNYSLSVILSPAQMRFCRLGADCLVGRQGEGAGCDHYGAGLTCLGGSSCPVATCRGQPSPTEVRDLPTATWAQVGLEPSLRDGSVQSDILCFKAWPRSTAADCS